jgi:hypothetical protein
MMTKSVGMGMMAAMGANFSVSDGWVGYLGWLLFGGSLVLYYRLWISSGVDELRKLKAALVKAHDTIERLSLMEVKLKNRNDELHTQHAKLHGEYLELRGQFSQLNIAYSKMGERFDAMQTELKEERELRDQQFMQWTRERAQRGDL